MNSILKPVLDNHIKLCDIALDYSSAFEYFTNYLAVRNYISRHFDPLEVSLGNRH